MTVQKSQRAPLRFWRWGDIPDLACELPPAVGLPLDDLNDLPLPFHRLATLAGCDQQDVLAQVVGSTAPQGPHQSTEIGAMSDRWEEAFTESAGGDDCQGRGRRDRSQYALTRGGEVASGSGPEPSRLHTGTRECQGVALLSAEDHADTVPDSKPSAKILVGTNHHAEKSPDSKPFVKMSLSGSTVVRSRKLPWAAGCRPGIPVEET